MNTIQENAFSTIIPLEVKKRWKLGAGKPLVRKKGAVPIPTVPKWVWKTVFKRLGIFDYFWFLMVSCVHDCQEKLSLHERSSSLVFCSKFSRATTSCQSSVSLEPKSRRSNGSLFTQSKLLHCTIFHQVAKNGPNLRIALAFPKALCLLRQLYLSVQLTKTQEMMP